MSRILVIVPFPLDEDGISRRRAQLTEVRLEPDSEFVFRAVGVGPQSFMSPHDWLLADVAVFEAGLSAQEEGFDAVCIDTVSDSGLAALRSVLDIPVVAPGHASMLFALTLGSRFSVIATWKPSAAIFRKLIPQFGLEQRCASVRSFDMTPDFSALMDGKEDIVFPRMLDVCLECIEKDGADVICLGSTTMHQAAGWLAERLPVPLVNPGPLAFKLAEGMLALRLTHSRVCYPKPLTPMASTFHKAINAVRRSA